MGIVVENPGLLTTVQDEGRFGYQQFGVSPAGTYGYEILLSGKYSCWQQTGRRHAGNDIFRSDTVV